MGLSTKIMVILLLICKIYLDVVHSCGIEMVGGKIVSNCTGRFTLHHGKEITEHQCNDTIFRTFRSPTLVSTENCSRVLLSHAEEPPLHPMDGYMVFWMSFSVVLLALLVPMLVLLVFLGRTGTRGGREFIISRIGVKLNSPISDHLFNWKQVILIGLFMIKPSYEACVSPHSSDNVGLITHLEYNLYQDEDACFANGRYSNEGALAKYSLAHLYDTSDWKETTWTERGCGFGNCGTEEQCSYWGDLGRVVNKTGTVYLKQCRPHETSLISCFYKWGCWLSTKEVHYTNKKLMSVYQIGKPVLLDRVKQSGSAPCTHSSSTDIGGLTLNHMVLVRGEEDWLCSSWSPRGLPKAGMLGDIQYFATSTPLFDFTAFECDTLSARSSGKCEVISSGASTLNHNCLKLPATTDAGLVSFHNDSLWSIASAPTKLSLLCSTPVEVVHSVHDCHGKSVKLLGIREEGSLQVLSFTASSPGRNSTWIVRSSCFIEQFEIPCDGMPHGHPVRHIHPETCSYSGLMAEDLRTDEIGAQWAWDNTDHTSIISENHAISITTIIFIIVLLCVLRLVCH